MKNGNFNGEDLLKTMLQIAKRSRKLTDDERKIDSKLAIVSQSRTKQIITSCCKEGWITQHPVIPQQPVIIAGSTIQRLFPYLSCDGGLSPNGEDKLRDLIKEFNKSLKDKNVYQFVSNGLEALYLL